MTPRLPPKAAQTSLPVGVAPGSIDPKGDRARLARKTSCRPPRSEVLTRVTRPHAPWRANLRVHLPPTLAPEVRATLGAALVCYPERRLFL